MRKSIILQSKENEICKKDRRQNLSFSIGTIPEGSGGIVPNIVPNIVPIELQKRSFCIAVGKENGFKWICHFESGIRKTGRAKMPMSAYTFLHYSAITLDFCRFLCYNK